MDLLSALSLAGNIIAFLDFGAKLIAKSTELCGSATGSTKENDEIQQITQDLRSLADSLINNLGNPNDTDNKALAQLAKDCKKLCDEFLSMLKKLKLKNPNSKAESPRTIHRYQAPDAGLRAKPATCGEDPSRTSGYQERNPRGAEGYTRQAWRRAARQTKTRQSFISWVTQGNGVFYVSGKAGSGKSTLMKYLCHSPVVKNKLERWAGDGSLIFAQAFFWSSGSALQRSLEGLYRSILWETLRECPDLIRVVFPPEKIGGKANDRASKMPFGASTIRSAMDTLAQQAALSESHKLCLFTDGLDEYEGDCWTLAQQLKALSEGSGIKICVSSRPHNEFETCFNISSQRFYLHSLTATDIWKFVVDQLKTDERFTNSATEKPKLGGCEELATRIVERAERVFLWARLVTQDLLRGMVNGCSLVRLQGLLQSMPAGLGEVFQKMFSSIDKSDRQRAAQTFLLFASTKSRLAKDPLAHSVVDDLLDRSIDVETLYEGKIELLHTSEEEVVQRIDNIARRINSRSKGLLRVVRDDLWQVPIVTAIHKSVADFLESQQIKCGLKRDAGPLDAPRLFAQAALWSLKHAAPFLTKRTGSLLRPCLRIPLLIVDDIPQIASGRYFHVNERLDLTREVSASFEAARELTAFRVDKSPFPDVPFEIVFNSSSTWFEHMSEWDVLQLYYLELDIVKYLASKVIAALVEDKNCVLESMTGDFELSHINR
ncbi:hypothetical protein OQA88_8431 [Cercophora sp. LCS_1]